MQEPGLDVETVLAKGRLCALGLFRRRDRTREGGKQEGRRREDTCESCHRRILAKAIWCQA
jgi:hypothetical protein